MTNMYKKLNEANEIEITDEDEKAVWAMNKQKLQDKEDEAQWEENRRRREARFTGSEDVDFFDKVKKANDADTNEDEDEYDDSQFSATSDEDDYFTDEDWWKHYWSRNSGKKYSYKKWYKTPTMDIIEKPEQHSNTLVLHPDDPSTVMLIPVYEGKGYDVIRDFSKMPKVMLREIIEDHDRIIMLGHGTPHGLINPHGYGYVIDDSFADILRTKWTASIWCNSDKYFTRNNIHGFHTGMIISETSEEQMCLGSIPLDKQAIYDNMIAFSLACRDAIEMDDTEKAVEIVKKLYNFDDPVSEFNRKNVVST